MNVLLLNTNKRVNNNVCGIKKESLRGLCLFCPLLVYKTTIF